MSFQYWTEAPLSGTSNKISSSCFIIHYAWWFSGCVMIKNSSEENVLRKMFLWFGRNFNKYTKEEKKRKKKKKRKKYWFGVGVDNSEAEKLLLFLSIFSRYFPKIAWIFLVIKNAFLKKVARQTNFSVFSEKS